MSDAAGKGTRPYRPEDKDNYDEGHDRIFPPKKLGKPTLRLTQSEFNELLEYSCSLPTGQTVGKQWKRNDNAYRTPAQPPRWSIGEYGIPYPEGHEYYGDIPITWYNVEITDAWPTCNECGAKFFFDPNEPFAFCDCGTSEWPETGRPDNYKEIQKGFENG